MKADRQSRTARRRRELLSSPRLLNETPDIIGKITTVLENGGSLDSAMRELAEEGPRISRTLFRRIVDDADTRVESDMSAALSRLLSEIPDCNSAYAMSVRMTMSAAGSKTPEERTRILKEASEIALNGLREAGKTFSSSLNTPCMVIFGLGMMVPMVLMSILPMMGMSGMFGGAAIDPGILTAITLVLIPAVVLSVVMSFRSRNPLQVLGREGFPLGILAYVSVPVFALLLSQIIGDPLVCLCVSIVLGSFLCLSMGGRDSGADRKRRRMESRLQDAVFEIGNRLLTGQSFEDSVHDTLRARGDCAALADEFRNEITITRGDVRSAIGNVFGRFSAEIENALAGIHRASLKNLADAGRLAVALGRQMKDRESLKKNIRNELKSMTDTMFGTASVFAPLVLGLSISMLGPMKNLTGVVDDGSSPFILAIYLVELCAQNALLLGFIDGRGGGREVVRRFSLMSACSGSVEIVRVDVVEAVGAGGSRRLHLPDGGVDTCLVHPEDSVREGCPYLLSDESADHREDVGIGERGEDLGLGIAAYHQGFAVGQTDVLGWFLGVLGHDGCKTVGGILCLGGKRDIEHITQTFHSLEEAFFYPFISIGKTV
ncbi:MAG: hypothetical protein MJZ38_06410 [archaeon]|nr:hypothetical protein [archaeon]